MTEDRLGWFGYIGKKNNEDIVKEIGKIRVEGNWGRSKPKKE